MIRYLASQEYIHENKTKFHGQILQSIKNVLQIKKQTQYNKRILQNLPRSFIQYQNYNVAYKTYVHSFK